MSNRVSNFALAAVLAFVTVGVSVAAAQQQPYRLSDRAAQDLVARILTDHDTFRGTFDRAIEFSSRRNGGDWASQINQSANDLKSSLDRLRDRVTNRRSSAADVQEVLSRAAVLDRFVQNNAFDASAKQDWQMLRGDLDELARGYDVIWTWNGSQPAPTGSANAPLGNDDAQLGRLLTRVELNTGRFRRSVNQALARTPVNSSREEDRITQFLTELTETSDHLRDHVERGEVVPGNVEDVLQQGVRIDSFMQRHRLTTQAQNDWLTLRRTLDDLARAERVAWDWSNPRNTTLQPVAGNASNRLTGTYQLDTNRSDDARRAADQATSGLPPAQRQRAASRLMSRLDAPDVIAIDRNGQNVSIASSLGPRVSFDVDGRVTTEPGAGGRSVATRATVNGDQLLVTTTGNRGNDFTVTFEPLDNGRTLRVTRRIVDDARLQPVTVQSLYRKSSDVPQWDVYSGTRAIDARTRGNELVIPDGTRLVATLDSQLSTSTARDRDRFTMTITSPSQYQGAVVEGFVSNVSQSGRLNGRADMALNFDTVRMPGGRTSQFTGVIQSVRTPDGGTFRVDNEGTVGTAGTQTEKTIQRGAIGAALGAIIGAIAGGGQGAAIGAAVGAAGGAGTVIAEGRNQLDLPRGTELSITASARGQ